MEKINFNTEIRYLPYADNLKRAFCGGIGALLFFFVVLPPALAVVFPGWAAIPWFPVAVSLFAQLGLGAATLSFLSGGRRLAEVLELNEWKSTYLTSGLRWGVIMLFITAGVQITFFNLAKWLFDFDLKGRNPVELLLGRLDWGGTMLLGMTALLVAPAVEEIFFRRVFFSFLAARSSWKAALAVTAAAFALTHASFVQLPGLIVLGIGFQLLYLRHGSLYPAIIAHATNNSIVMTIMICAKYYQPGGL